MSTQPDPTSTTGKHYIDPSAPGAAAPHFQAKPANVGQAPSARITDDKPQAATFPLREFADDAPNDCLSLDTVRDVELDVTIELGRTEMALEDVVKLQPGMVVALDTLVGDLVDVVVNGRLIARGEVVVVDDNFCVRVVELITQSEAA
ncbi:MAG: flagellar motor switch protein FliN [Pirellulales bacterium]